MIHTCFVNKKNQNNIIKILVFAGKQLFQMSFPGNNMLYDDS